MLPLYPLRVYLQENAALKEANTWNTWRERLQQKQLDGAACQRKSEVSAPGCVLVDAVQR
jgi:hypothetical protein